VSKHKRIVFLYYLFQFFFSLLLWLPVFYEYQKRIGLTDSQIFSIQSIYYLAFCLLEIPTGMLADLLGRLACLRGGSLVLVIANLLPVLLPTYDGMLIHFCLIALSRSLISGASSAYLYDYLVREGQVGLYKEIEGTARTYSLIGKVIGWAFIGSLMNWHLGLPYWLTSLAALIAVFAAWSLPVFKELPTVKERISPIHSFSQVVFILIRSPGLLLIMLQGVAIFVLSRICQVNLFQPILSAKSFGLPSMGLVMSLMTLFEAAGSYRPGWVQRWVSDLNAVFILTWLMALSLLLIPWSGAFATLGCLAVFSYAAGLSFPVQRQLLNDAVLDSRFRATLLSVESIMDRAVCAWVASLIGASLSRGGLDQFLVNSALATLLGMGGLVVLLYWIRVRKGSV